jgi:DNA-binding Xre family transcriptional regulator
LSLSSFFLLAMGLELKSDSSMVEVTDLQAIRDSILRSMAHKSMTLKKLAEQTGLSQVSLRKIRQGNDLRVSSLLAIAHALDLKVLI